MCIMNTFTCVSLASTEVVFTGQEAPTTDRDMREDLYKKIMSADPVPCRLPYAVVTKMVSFVGWKRLEMNEMLKFNGVTEGTFPSILRCM